MISKIHIPIVIAVFLFMTYGHVLAEETNLNSDRADCENIARGLATSKIPTKDVKVSFWSGVSTQTKEKEVFDKQRYKDEFDKCMKEKKAERERDAAASSKPASPEQHPVKAKSNIDQLEELKAMKDKGLIRDQEYELKKKEILSRM
ncbi:MAG TPA: SHOCT domain-containing protein [Dissulfurispiraceae bacterium]|nr:SHOCT domain-containing protein [Dissulfurispiraceae bacterium]